MSTTEVCHYYAYIKIARLISTKPESTARCVPRALQRPVSTTEGDGYRANCLPGPPEPYKRVTAYLATEATEGAMQGF